MQKPRLSPIDGKLNMLCRQYKQDFFVSEIKLYLKVCIISWDGLSISFEKSPEASQAIFTKQDYLIQEYNSLSAFV